jgi:DNA-binding MarR family transcriptional regulator
MSLTGILDLSAQLERYIRDNLGIVVSLESRESEGRVPLYLQDRYHFRTGELMGQRCLFLLDKSDQEESPAAISKHIAQVRDKWGDPVIYVRERVTAYNRKRLIEHKVPFIVPGNQMFLPMLGIDLREHFWRLREDRSELGPAAQAVLIRALLLGTDEFSPTELAKALHYSIMTMSRVLDELEDAGLGESIISGRIRGFRLLESKRATWEKAQPILRNPVENRHVVHMMPPGNPPGPKAGLSALSHYTMLAEPANETIAHDDILSFRKKFGSLLATVEEPGSVTVEFWRYSPMMCVSDGCVDRLSLYLSLRDSPDERVQAALEQLMKDVPW